MDGGERGVGTRRATNYGMMPIDEYWEHSRTEPLIIFQIEHREAVANLDEILAVPGWDSVCIGPYDLSASYGKPGAFTDPEVQEALGTICVKTRKAGKMLGGFIGPGFPISHHMDWRAIGVDMGFVMAGLKDSLAKAKDDGVAKAGR